VPTGCAVAVTVGESRSSALVVMLILKTHRSGKMLTSTKSTRNT
jgi:hypothetical protein